MTILQIIIFALTMFAMVCGYQVGKSEGRKEGYAAGVRRGRFMSGGER